MNIHDLDPLVRAEARNRLPPCHTHAVVARMSEGVNHFETAPFMMFRSGADGHVYAIFRYIVPSPDQNYRHYPCELIDSAVFRVVEGPSGAYDGVVLSLRELRAALPHDCVCSVIHITDCEPIGSLRLVFYVSPVAYYGHTPHTQGMLEACGISRPSVTICPHVLIREAFHATDEVLDTRMFFVHPGLLSAP